jgi:hypothetical protein
MCRLKSYLAGFVLAEIGCAVRVKRKYLLWKWSVLPCMLASPVIVGAGIGRGGRGASKIIDRGSGRFFRGVLCPPGSWWL